MSRTAVRRALALDSLLPEVQFAAAASQTWVDWDFRAADARFQRAIQLNDRYAEARAYYAHLLIFLQRPEEAVEQATFAIELDPLNTLIGALGCVTLAHVGAAEDALTQCSEVLRLDPTQPVAFDGRLVALRRLGRFEEFVADDAARARALGSPQLADAVEQGFADGGFQLAMRRMAETLEAQAERGEYVPPSLMASVLIDAGDVEAALDWLERGEQARDPSMPYLAAASSAVTAGLHDHPRYLALRERMGLAQGGG